MAREVTGQWTPCYCDIDIALGNRFYEARRRIRFIRGTEQAVTFQLCGKAAAAESDGGWGVVVADNVDTDAHVGEAIVYQRSDGWPGCAALDEDIGGAI